MHLQPPASRAVLGTLERSPPCHHSPAHVQRDTLWLLPLLSQLNAWWSQHFWIILLQINKLTRARSSTRQYREKAL